MTLPTCSIKECAKYQIDEQSRSLCVQKPGTADHYLSHVTRKSTKSSLDDFSWSSLLKKWKVHLLTCLISRPLWVYCCTRRWKSSTSSVCDIWLCHEYSMLGAKPRPKSHNYHPWYCTLQSQGEYNSSNYKQFFRSCCRLKKNHFTSSLFLEKQLYNLNLEISQA